MNLRLSSIANCSMSNNNEDAEQVKEIRVGQGGEKSDMEPQSDPLGDFIGYQIRMAQILAFRAFEEKLTKYGRAPRYLGLLATIRAEPGLSQSTLAEAVALRRSSLVNILDQLEGDGLLVRKAAPNDRRRNGVWLTEKGQDIVTALLREAKAEDNRMTKDLSKEQITQLNAYLAQIIKNLKG